MHMSGGATLLDGRQVAKQLEQDLATKVSLLKAQGVTPSLATVLVGDDPSSVTYVNMKCNACKRLGMEYRRIHLPKETTTEELLQLIDQLNSDRSVHGILLQHPVPSHIDERAAFDAIAAEKDVDGVTTQGFGSLSMGEKCYLPATPAALMRIIDFYNIATEGRHAVVIGRSPILGRPAAMLLLQRNATVTICHSRTQELPRLVKQADIIVAAVGKPCFVQGEWVKPGAIVLDAGYNPNNIGDVDFRSCQEKAGAITPVPGGVGPVTIASLLANTVEAAAKRPLSA